MMKAILVVAAAVSWLALPGMAGAQAPVAGPETGVQLEKRQRRTLVPPRTDVEAVERDVDRAIDLTRDSAELRRRAEEAANPQFRRPDLGQDVTGGIQTRNLNRAR